MNMVIAIATFEWSRWEECVASWNEKSYAKYPVAVAKRMDILDAYQRIFEEKPYADVIAYVHDDVIVNEQDWDLRVLKEFEDPSVGLVGFGGASQHGSGDMYKSPYGLCQLGRLYFCSNMRNAEQHGERMTGVENSAVLDGFSIFVRRDVLVKAGGWPIGTPIGYFCYDMWISCMTRRHGYKIKTVGVACDHLGGQSTGLNPNLRIDFEGAHRYMYDNFQDVLPCYVEP